MANGTANWLASHFALTTAIARTGLRAGHVAEATLGHTVVSALSGGMWRNAALRAAPVPTQRARTDAGGEPIVYFAGCAGRMFASGEASLADTIVRLCEAAGYRVIQPANRDELCCGQPFKSKGLFDAAQTKAEELERALEALSGPDRRMIVFDASACALRMKEHVQSRLPVFDFIEFAHDHLLPKLQFKRKPQVALHVNCSARRMQLADQLRDLARACAERVIEPAGIQCCGFGGDRGFSVPELNAHALRRLADQIPPGCTEGYSSNLTCEIGLTDHAGIPYRSIAHLMEETLTR
jgi:D-lactate dehydrogenase